MENDILKWLKGIFYDFQKLLYGSSQSLPICENYEMLLWFTFIGIALTVFALSQKEIPLYQLLQKIYSGKFFINFPMDDREYLRKIRSYIRLLDHIENVGSFYFLSAICLLILTIYPKSASYHNSIPYILLVNLSFLFTLIPTVSIGLFYTYLKLLRKI